MEEQLLTKEGLGAPQLCSSFLSLPQGAEQTLWSLLGFPLVSTQDVTWLRDGLLEVTVPLPTAVTGKRERSQGMAHWEARKGVEPTDRTHLGDQNGTCPSQSVLSARRTGWGGGHQESNWYPRCLSELSGLLYDFSFQGTRVVLGLGPFPGWLG